MTGLLSSAGAAALAAAAFAAPANAAESPYSGYSPAVAKSRAILGGTPSRLEQILARQQGRPMPVAIAPASRSLPTIRSADLRTYRPKPAAAWSGRPDLFGSVALRVGHTSLDPRWKRVAGARLPINAAMLPAAVKDADESDKIEAVNRFVNRRIRFVDDSREFGRADHWSTASESLRRGRGDCEDYAIAKMQLLRAAGIRAENLYLVLVRDTVRRADHAVLVVRSGGRNLMLDNGTDAIFDTEAVQDYRPIFTFAATGTWTHGYRRASETPLTIASRGDDRLADDVRLASLSAREVLRPAPSSPASEDSSARSYGP